MSRWPLGKLKVFSGRDVRRILEDHGFTLVRQRGSHFVMQRRDETGATTVPVPDHKELKAGVLGAVIRQTGLPRALFEM